MDEEKKIEMSMVMEYVLKTIDGILQNFQAYRKVDATLSKDTLLRVAVHLKRASDELERGFVNDAVNEVESKMGS